MTSQFETVKINFLLVSVIDNAIDRSFVDSIVTHLTDNADLCRSKRIRRKYTSVIRTGIDQVDQVSLPIETSDGIQNTFITRNVFEIARTGSKREA